MKLTKEAKEQIVKRYLAGKKADALIKEIGIFRNTIYLWVKQFNEGNLKKENQISEKFLLIHQKYHIKYVHYVVGIILLRNKVYLLKALIMAISCF